MSIEEVNAEAEVTEVSAEAAEAAAVEVTAETEQTASPAPAHTDNRGRGGARRNPNSRGPRDQGRPRRESDEPEFIEKLVSLNRVSKTVKGGRIFKFAALMVVGDGKGKVGYGIGKAGEVSEAIRKGVDAAKKKMVTVTLRGSTIPHEVTGAFGAGRVLLKPAPAGTGVIAGGAVRAVVEAAGIKDIRTKCLRSNNPINVVSAAFVGLTSLRDAGQVGEVRGKSPREVLAGSK
jgi:small subunit ribosomal protein S5